MHPYSRMKTFCMSLFMAFMAFMAILAACSAGTEDSDARRLHEYVAEGKEQYLDGGL